MEKMDATCSNSYNVVHFIVTSLAIIIAVSIMILRFVNLESKIRSKTDCNTLIHIVDFMGGGWR